jgi:hypothetical protein
MSDKAKTHPDVYERAAEAIADTFCSMHLTDGFCTPSNKPDCRCKALAKTAMAQLRVRGMQVVWPYSRNPEHH